MQNKRLLQCNSLFVLYLETHDRASLHPSFPLKITAINISVAKRLLHHSIV